jgi:hypothetical protein
VPQLGLQAIQYPRLSSPLSTELQNHLCATTFGPERLYEFLTSLERAVVGQSARDGGTIE